MNFGPIILPLHSAVFSIVYKWVLVVSDFQNCGLINEMQCGLAEPIGRNKILVV